MRKVLEYNFLPSKEEEEAAKACGVAHAVTGRVVEMQDLYPPPPRDPSNPWVIRRTLSGKEILDGRISLSQKDILDHVMRYWPMEHARFIMETGGRRSVPSVDCSDPSRRQRMYVESVPTDHCYVVGWLGGVLDRFQCGDEIGLFWDDKANTLNFKLLNPASSSSR